MDKPILTKTDITNAKTGLYKVHLAEQEIGRMKACGLDCSEQEMRCQHLKEYLQAVVDQYSPLVNPHG